jgi:hypothetical protein
MDQRGRTGYHLVVAHGKNPDAHWSLPTDDRRFLIGRAGHETTDPTFANLFPDHRVSREHAQIWYASGVWWIEDVGSTYGTVVDGHELAPRCPVRLRPWSEIVLGRTILFFAPPGWHRLKGRDLVIDLTVAGAINASLAHAGLPIVERLVARSRSEDTHRPAQARIMLEPYIETATVMVPELQPGASVVAPLPPLAVRYDVLEGVTSKQLGRRLTLTLDGELLSGDKIDCPVLPYNEWSMLPEHRQALATFVLHDHPDVDRLCTEVVAAVGMDASAHEVLGALFEVLAERWHLAYRDEPLNWAENHQKIRLPHQVLVNESARRGEGTCIDLALLVAGCLENLKYGALIAIVDLGDQWHALVGCWETPVPGLEVLPNDVSRLLDRAIWIDPTALAHGSDVGHSYAEARAEAERCLRDSELVFGLDVAAARNARTMPLPYSGTPPWSPAAEEAIKAARTQASTVNGQLCSAALLAGLLATADPLTCRAVAECAGVDAEVARKTIVASLPPARPDRAPTPGYLHVLELARARSRVEKSHETLTTHLYGALVAVQSISLRHVLNKLGTDQGCLLEMWWRFGAPASDADDQSGTSFT